MPTHTPSERRKNESNLDRARLAGRTAPGAGRTAATDVPGRRRLTARGTAPPHLMRKLTDRSRPMKDPSWFRAASSKAQDKKGLGPVLRGPGGPTAAEMQRTMEQLQRQRVERQSQQRDYGARQPTKLFPDPQTGRPFVDPVTGDHFMIDARGAVVRGSRR
jgi:hypothetical protein